MESLAIDVRMAHHSGIGRYIRGFLSAFEKTSWLASMTLIGNTATRNLFQKWPKTREVNASVYGFNEQIRMLPFMKDYAGLHVPHYNVPFFWNRKLIITIHDLIHLHFPEYLPSLAARAYARIMLPLAVGKADAIIAVSEHTKNDLVKTLKVNAAKITVIYHGVDSNFLNLAKEYSKNGDRYLLYVGLLKPHKNLDVLFKAFFCLKQKSTFGDLKLHLVGRPDTKHRIVRKWLDIINTNPDITLTTGINDDKLAHEYQSASVFVMPSKYEGFGFPLLEAMTFGIPIVASHAASIPEVVGEAGVFFDPRSVSGLEAAIKSVLEKPGTRDELCRLGRLRASSFSWERTVKQMSRLYEGVL